MSFDGLETGVQQRRVHAVSGLLRADLARQRHLGQDGAGLVAGMNGAQAGERGTVLDAASVHPPAHLVAVIVMRVRGQ